MKELRITPGTADSLCCDEDDTEPISVFVRLTDLTKSDMLSVFNLLYPIRRVDISEVAV